MFEFEWERLYRTKSRRVENSKIQMKDTWGRKAKRAKISFAINLRRILMKIQQLVFATENVPTALVEHNLIQTENVLRDVECVLLREEIMCNESLMLFFQNSQNRFKWFYLRVEISSLLVCHFNDRTWLVTTSFWHDEHIIVMGWRNAEGSIFGSLR